VRSVQLETAFLKEPSEDAAKVNRAWQDPGILDLLKGSPVNCLVVTWAAGKPEDAAQQQSLQTLIQGARARGLAVVGRVLGDVPAAHSAAEAAGLDAVVADKCPAGGGIPAIATAKVDDFKLEGYGPLAALVELPWPQIPSKPQGGSGGENAGPTGNPWIDSNGWAVQLARTLAPERTYWVMVDPPLENRVLSTEAYLVALGDACSRGARWPVALDTDLRGRLATGDARALKIWQGIAKSMAFHEARRTEILEQRVVARLGVCSDFRGENAYLATEFLNLAARRWLPVRILKRDRTTAAGLEGLKGIVWIEDRPPAPELAKTLDRFVSSGGLLIVPASVAHFADGLTPLSQRDPAYALYTKGQGRIAVAREPWGDPFQLAGEAHILLSRRNDVLRLFNAGLCTACYTQGGGKDMVQVLNFVGRNWSYPTTLYVAKKYRSARVVSPDLPGGKPVEVIPRDSGVELKIPTFSVYAGVELEG
jgi:hypothetical protein